MDPNTQNPTTGTPGDTGMGQQGGVQTPATPTPMPTPVEPTMPTPPTEPTPAPAMPEPTPAPMGGEVPVAGTDTTGNPPAAV